MKRLFLTLAFVLNAANALAQTLVGDGVTDNTATWNQLVSNVCASNDRRVALPAGKFRFASPMAPIPCSLQVQGQGPGVSVFKFDYSSTEGYWVTGGIDGYGGGSLRDVTIVVTSGHTVGFAVHIQAHLETDPNVLSHNPHGWLADNVLVGRDENPPFTGVFTYGFYLDGSANASPPSGIAPGIRLVRVLNSSVSSATSPALTYYAYGSFFSGFFCPSGPYIMSLHANGSTYVPAPNACPLNAVD